MAQDRWSQRAPGAGREGGAQCAFDNLARQLLRHLRGDETHRTHEFMVALQERMAGPRYDCYGPWAMCPADIVAQFA